MPRLPTTLAEPEGLVYGPDFVSEEEERGLVAVFEELEFGEVRMHGQTARRPVVHFGYRYDYEAWRLTPVDPLPQALGGLRDRAGALVRVDPELLVETLVTRYPPGAGIGWHRDAPLFGPKVVGVSLLSALFDALPAADRHGARDAHHAPGGAVGIRPHRRSPMDLAALDSVDSRPPVLGDVPDVGQAPGGGFGHLMP